MATFGSLFAGIGGIDLGLERAGWDCRFQVEWDPFCQRVLARHWPDVPRYGDIASVDWTGVEPVDLLAGGFPCQPFSVAGKQRRLEDDRWLWPEFARAIRELRPRFVLVENVPGLLVGGGMGAVLGDLATLGYDAEWESIPAAAVGAPHLRYRVWIIGTRRPELGRLLADADNGRPFDAVRAGGDAARDGGAFDVADTDSERRAQPSRGPEPMDEEQRSASCGCSASYAAHTCGEGLEGLQRDQRLQSGRPLQEGSPTGSGALLADAAGRRQPRPGQLVDAVDPAEAAAREAAQPLDGRLSEQWLVEPDVGRVAHGVPARVDRLRALGNAVVPQVVEVIGRQLLASIEAVA